MLKSTISARGMPDMVNSGGGSGGSILLTALSFEGGDTGVLRANGTGGGGGGGRIAIWTPFQEYANVQEMAASANLRKGTKEIDPAKWSVWTGTETVTGYNQGTVFFGRLIFGTMFNIH